MTKEKYVENLSSNGNFVINKIYPMAYIVSKKDVKEELEGNECFCTCENIPSSKYKFYVDTEVIQYFATLKKEVNN